MLVMDSDHAQVAAAPEYRVLLGPSVRRPKHETRPARGRILHLPGKPRRGLPSLANIMQPWWRRIVPGGVSTPRKHHLDSNAAA